MNTPVREGETIEGSRTMRNRPYPVLKCSREKSEGEGAYAASAAFHSVLFAVCSSWRGTRRARVRTPDEVGRRAAEKAEELRRAARLAHRGAGTCGELRSLRQHLCGELHFSGEALATKLALVAPGTGSSATLFESERRRRLSTNLCNAGAGCVGPHHRTPSGSRLPTSRGS